MTLIQSLVRDEDAAAVEDFGLSIRRQMGMDPSYRSLSVWKDADFPGRFLTLLHLSTESVVELASANLSDTPEFEALSRSHLAPADIRVLTVRHRRGGTPTNVEIGGFLSLSMRKSEPGYSDELRAELVDIFESLQYIDGYVGSVIGPNQAVVEEVLGVVLWTNRRSFEASIPGPSPYEVRLFERIS